MLTAALVLLTGCGGGTDATDKAVSVAEQAIEAADSYLDGDMSYDEVKEKLADLEDDMEYAKDMPKDTAEEIKQQSADYSISTDISVLSIKIMSDNIDNSSDSYDEVVEARNELAADAGLEKR